MPHNYDLASYAFLLVPAAALLAWVLSVRIYPVIIYISDKKNLMDEPDQRSSHSKKTPTLGGVGMFVSFAVALMLFGIFVSLQKVELIRLIAVVASTIILLFLGMKDDLIVLAPRKKFIGQIFAAGIVIFLTDVRITSFGGIMGIWELPYVASVLFTLCVFIVVVNAFNLTDGIDGLAGSLALFCSFCFGLYFLINGEHMLSLVSFTLIGAIVGFLNFNFSDTEKLFMGDSGSLFLGYLLAYQGVSMVMISSAEPSGYALPHAPIILLALLSYPITDSLRVFTIRILQGRSPFSADRNHIHHRFIEVGFTHVQATLAIVFSNLILVCLIWLVNTWDPTVQFFLGLGGALILYLYPYLMKEKAAPALMKVPADPEMKEAVKTNPFPENLYRTRERIVYELQRPFRSSEPKTKEKYSRETATPHETGSEAETHERDRRDRTA